MTALAGHRANYPYPLSGPKPPKLPPLPTISLPNLNGAACDEHPDPELWFADSSTAPPWRKQLNIKTAKSICRSCPTQQACLQYAITENIRDGIWGGQTAEQRATYSRGTQRCDRIDCQRLFHPRTVTQKYCSTRCGDIVSKRRNRTRST